ncbi:MAG: glycosyltransferase family 2 protein, partial [Clostridiales bacterium]|nr:glycosyltransferase family 2 protein [Clostridiales bacterium]
MNSVVIIPALNPGAELLAYVRELLSAGLPRIVVVDDGSGKEYEEIFAEMADLSLLTVLRHKQNCGKGRALKTAMEYVLAASYTCDGVITVDADGQHALTDVCRVARIMAEGKEEFVLGCRDFSLPGIPFRSRLGNRTTSLLFKLLYGAYLPDTQTGLRGIPACLLPDMLKIEGERFDYEMSVLVELLRTGVKICRITIETKYFNKNEGSHYST